MRTLGPATEPLPDPSREFLAVMPAVVALVPADRLKRARCLQTYPLEGQVPSAETRQIRHPDRDEASTAEFSQLELRSSAVRGAYEDRPFAAKSRPEI